MSGGHIADWSSIGYLLARHHEPITDESERNVTFRARLDEEDKAEGIDVRPPRLQWVGDDVGWLWAPPRDDMATGSPYAVAPRQRSEDVGAWANAFPIVWTNEGGVPLWSREQADPTLLPWVNTTEMDVSDFPENAAGALQILDGQRPRIGEAGILLPGTDPTNQLGIYVPLREHVASHRSDPAYSTPIWETMGPGEIDYRRGGGLHSMVKVVHDGSEFVPALMFGAAPDGTGYGTAYGKGDASSPDSFLLALIDQLAGGTGEAFTEGGENIHSPGQSTVPEEKEEAPPESGNIVAFLSHERGGPLHPGHSTNDKHRFGTNADGEAINPMHISLTPTAPAKFFRDRIQDGPLHVKTWKKPNEGFFPVPVYFGWNVEAEAWDWYSDIYDLPPEKDPPDPPIIIFPPEIPEEEPPIVIAPGVPGQAPSGGGGAPGAPGVGGGSPGAGPGGAGGDPGDPGSPAGSPPGGSSGGTASEPSDQTPPGWRPRHSPFEISAPSFIISGQAMELVQPYDGRYGWGDGEDLDWLDEIWINPRVRELGVETNGFFPSGSDIFSEYRGGPTPHTAHIMGVPKVDEETRFWSYLSGSEPGMLTAYGTSEASVMLVAPMPYDAGHASREGVDYSNVCGRLELGLRAAGNSGPAESVALAWGWEDWFIGGMVGGPVLAPSGTPGQYDLTLGYRDSSGAARRGSLFHVGDYYIDIGGTQRVLAVDQASSRRIGANDGVPTFLRGTGLTLQPGGAATLWTLTSGGDLLATSDGTGGSLAASSGLRQPTLGVLEVIEGAEGTVRPETSGQALGDDTHRWAVYADTLDIEGDTSIIGDVSVDGELIFREPMLVVADTSLSLDPTVHKNVVFTASGNTTATLPAAPEHGTEFRVRCQLGAGSVLTVDRNGNNINGAGTNLSLSSNESRLLVYDDVTESWWVMSCC